MTFLAPAFLVAAAGAAAVVAALHFLSFRRPPPRPLPTARFLPERPVRAVAAFRRPTDLSLLALRALALLLVGAAFARPVRPPAPGSVVRVFLVDHSRAVASAAEAADTLRRLARPGDAVVRFDSAAGAPEPFGGASLGEPSLGNSAAAGQPSPGPPAGAGLPAAAPGSLSAALVAAGRAARLVRGRADSVELVIVSPLVREEIDAATLAIRRAWPGRVRLARVAAAVAPADSAPPRVEFPDASPSDPLLATGELLGGTEREAAGARVVRGAPGGADSAWVRAARGRRLVVWPVSGVPNGWTRRARSDTVGALVAGADVVVAPFARGAELAPAGEARVVARWVDGAPAAVERALGGGCVREVAVRVPTAGDLVLAPSFVRVARALTGPCGGAGDLRVIERAALGALAGSGPLARASAVGESAEVRSPLAKWLLGAALALLLVEPLVRRPLRGREAAA